MWTIRADEIEAAMARIDRVFVNTPVRRSTAIDRRFGAKLLFKDETANPIRSLKGRGACNLVAQLKDCAGIVCGSAGNFGQAMAWAVRRRGASCTVFASTNAVRSKIEAMRRLGADVVLTGKDFDDAKGAAEAWAAERGMLYMEDGAHAPLAEGAGTIAFELEGEDVDVMLCPLGNGALAGGVGGWLKHARPACEMVAVAAAGAPAMADSVRRGIVETRPADTIADGIAVRNPIPSAVAPVRQVVDNVVLVRDYDIRLAMILLRDALDLIVEPAGAAGLAALIAEPARWAGRRVAIPLSGGNI